LAALDSHYGFPVPLLAGDHVTDDAGTGFVHTAPGHGAEDYDVWRAHGHHEIPETVDPDGAYYDHVPLFGGLKIIETEGKKAGRFGPANDAVIDRLIEAGTLLARGRLEHSYPHSWRSGAPVIFRNTPQWFVRMDEPASGASGRLREKALDAIDATAFYPEAGRTRIRSMVEGRPDWLISRQRAWGTPLAMFVDKETGQPLHDPAVDQRITDAIATEGADAWFTRPARDFLGHHDPERYEKIEDILDVWFDSGSTHAFTLENRNDTRWPADLYLEGSDQHRGWFQSSLLEGCGTRGRAPFDVVLTHGFTLDESGRKMSKSLGNQTFPQDVIRVSGADILRLWVASVDYTDDQRIGPEILKAVSDNYRKLRNTTRWMLGTLAHRESSDSVGYSAMTGLERLMLHKLAELDLKVREAYENFDFARVVATLTAFMNADLSAFYFDIRKDALYCDPPSSVRRRGALEAIEHIFHAVTVWLAPVLVFTAEEAWSARDAAHRSIHLEQFPAIPTAWRDDELAKTWETIRLLRLAVTGAIEIARAEKRIGSSLEAAPRVYLSNPGHLKALEEIDFAEVCITSDIAIEFGTPMPLTAFRLPEAPDVGVVVERAQGIKCARSWRYFDPATASPDFPDVTPRDAQALRELKNLGRLA
jgi:isoleucyl-tRNA synthetase